jgi:DNA-binding CsgD family transcriptional regulator
VSAEPEPQTSLAPAATRQTSLIRSGAELVHLGEDLYLRLYVLTLLLTVVGSALAIWFALVASKALVPLTVAIALITATGASWALTDVRRSYVWFREDRVRRLLPIAWGALAMLVNGPDSPSWWIALPMLWLTAAVGTTLLALVGAAVAGAAYLAGTAFGGEPLVRHGNAEILAAAIGLPANVLVGALLATLSGRFVVSLHRIEQGRRPRALDITPSNVGPSTRTKRPPSAVRTLVRPALGRRDEQIGLSPREFEASALLTEGREYPEIAECMGIETREVERLLESARHHVSAHNNTHLAALMVALGHVP